MLFSSRPRAAWTACGVKLGCDASDWKKLLSWMLGRNGSVGHPAAISLSFRADLEADMTLQPMFFCSNLAEVVAGRIVCTPPRLSESPGRGTFTTKPVEFYQATLLAKYVPQVHQIE